MTTAREPLLLDTHVWIWLNEGTAQLRKGIIDRIDGAAARGGALVSVMSVWEVSLLHAKRRVVLGLALPAWVRNALAPPIALAPLTPEIAVEANQLPEHFQDDPADRVLVATARREGLTLVTRDRAILAFAARGHLRALAC